MNHPLERRRALINTHTLTPLSLPPPLLHHRRRYTRLQVPVHDAVLVAVGQRAQQRVDHVARLLLVVRRLWVVNVTEKCVGGQLGWGWVSPPPTLIDDARERVNITHTIHTHARQQQPQTHLLDDAVEELAALADFHDEEEPLPRLLEEAFDLHDGRVLERPQNVHLHRLEFCCCWVVGRCMYCIE